MIENELRECAGLLSDEEIAARHRSEIRARLHRLADRVRKQESPYITVTEAARRWGIDRKDLRKMIDLGQVETCLIAGRERIDVRKVEM